MPTLNIEGRKVTVDDSFMKLSPDEQNSTVEEIAASFKQPKESAGSDAYKSFDAGVAKGVGMLGGAVGDLTNLGAKGIGAASDYVSDKLGVERYKRPEGPSILDKIPTSESMGKAIQEKYYNGEAPYEPQSKTGKVLNKIGEFAPSMAVGPGGLISKGLATVGAGAGAEYGGDAAAGLLSEKARPYGELVGGVAGGLTPAALGRAITPLPASPARQRLVDVLAGEGVDSLSAGQRTGNKSLQYSESFLGDGPLAGQGASRIQQRGQEQFTEAAMRRTGANAAEATPEVLAANQHRLGDQFRDLSARNTLTPDNQFITDITAAVRDYRNVPNSQQRAMVQGYVDDIIGHVNAGQMSGAQYQEMRSRLSRQSHALRQSDPTLSDALRDMRIALDDAMGRSIPPGSADQALWQQSRREYAAQRTVEDTASKAGAAITEGQIPPSALRNTVAANNRGAYARGQGDFSELARAGSGIMAPLPNSGTAQRSQLSNLLMLPVSATAGRALMSRPAQAYLGNQLLAGQLEQLPAAQQALIRALLSQDRQSITGPTQ